MERILENIASSASGILAQDMALVALGGGAIIGAIVAMILYSIIFELILPISKKLKSAGKTKNIKEEIATPMEAPTPPPIEAVATMNYDPAAAEQEWLSGIERQLIALRELYEAGLIAPEIYLLKSRELAAPALEKN